MKKHSIVIFSILLGMILNSTPVKSASALFYSVNDYIEKNQHPKQFSDALNKLIVDVHEKGGGTIYFPAGIYQTAAIKLVSNITIHIEAGAVLKFSDNFEDYLPMVESRYEGVDVYSFCPFFYANRAENITITGRGTIDGQGKKWWYKHWEHFDKPIDENELWQKEFREKNKNMIMPGNPWVFERGFCRPPFIQPMYCKNVRIEGITIINSPFWTVNPEFCENVTITGITINNPDSPNTDGINPESCKNVRISDCHISVGDDCITIKSGKDIPGRTKATPAENYTITNCTMLSGHGGVVIGSEMSGDVKNIVISNCIFDGTDRGIRVKTVRGRGGVVEDIRVSNVIMRNILKEAVILNMQYTDSDPEPISERTPQFRNIHISNVTGDAKKAIVVKGLPEMPVENISFTNIDLETNTGVVIEEARAVRFTNFSVANHEGAAFKIIHASKVELNGCAAKNTLIEIPVIELENVQKALIHNSFQTETTDLFLGVKGKNTEAVYFKNNTLLNVKKKVDIANEVGKNAVVVE